jgi:mono/diheme cytochrome c family protein
VYILSTLGDVTPERTALAQSARARAETGWAAQSTAAAADADSDLQLGASVYTGACASCHDSGRQISSAGALQLPLAVALYDADPRSLIRIILEGITPPEGETYRWMPAFAGALTDEQLTALVRYLRVRAAGQPQWPDVAAEVRKAQRG